MMSMMTWTVTPRRAASARIRLELVLGPVDQDDPGPAVAGVAGPGLVERGGDDLGGVLADRPGQPLGPGLGPGPQRRGFRCARRAGRSRRAGGVSPGSAS